MGKGQRLKEAKRTKRAEQLRKAATAVASIMVRCPQTDEFFPTGVSADPGSFQTSTFKDMATQCPHCGRMHRWGDSEIALDN